MLGEVNDLDVAVAVDHVSQDEALLGELIEQRVGVAPVVWEHLCLDSMRPIFEAPASISQAPESLKEQSPDRRNRRQLFVHEEGGLERTQAWHRSGLRRRVSQNAVKVAQPSIAVRLDEARTHFRGDILDGVLNHLG